VAERIRHLAGDKLPTWLREAVEAKLTNGGLAGAPPSSAFDQGWRAGWAAANQQFRDALKKVLASPPPEPS
jgi:hypothetical protein